MVDVVNAVHLIGSSIKQRIDAARHLPEMVSRCVHTIDQIEGAVDGVGDDTATAATMQTIRDLLKSLELVIERLEDQGATAAGSACGRCFGMMKNGKDALLAEEELQDTDNELRKQLDLLVKSTELSKYANRRSNVLKQRDARKFWDAHFGEDREASLDALGEALRFEASEQKLEVDLDTVVPICKAVFAGKKQVSVLQFGEVFSKPIPETLVELSKRTLAASHMFKVKIFRMPQREEDRELDAGMLMCRETDSLAALRSLIKKHALELHEQDEDDDTDEDDDSGPTTPLLRDHPMDEQMDPELEFLRKGKFAFFLDDGDTRVRKKQEKTFCGTGYIDRVVIVRNSDLPSAKESLPGQPSRRGSDATSDAVSEISEPAEIDIAEQVMRAAMENGAEAISFDDVLADERMLLSMKKLALKRSIGEEAVNFLVELKALRSAAAMAVPDLEQLRTGAWKIMLRFFQNTSSFKLPISSFVLKQTESKARRVSGGSLPGEAGSARAILACFSGAQAEVEEALQPCLAGIRKAQRHEMRVTSKIAELAADVKRIVVVGGGYLGTTVAKQLDLMDGYHVTLIDPKEYFEDVTAQPAAITSPGDDLADTASTWPRSVIPYKGSTIINGTHVTGFITAVAKDHVQVGSKRKIVKFDFLVLATGSSYSSNIKAPNASLAFRHKQMTQEFKAIKDASSVMIVGGGLVGCEICGAIKEEFPDKKVTIVQRGSAFLPRVRGAHEKVCAVWDEMGVDWHVNEEIVRCDELSDVYTAKSGKVFKADKVYMCSGPTANTGFLYDGQTDSRFTAAMDRRNFLKTHKTGQVKGFDNVFCGGDMVSDEMHNSFGSHAGERTAQSASRHGAVIARNIIRMVAGETNREKLMQWDTSKNVGGTAAVVSLGKTRSLFCAGRDLGLKMQQMYGAFGVNLDLPADVLDDHGCGIGPFQFLKDMTTGMIIGGQQTDWRKGAEVGTDGQHSMFVGMAAMSPEFVDPLAVPPPLTAGAEPEPEPQPQPQPEPEPMSESESVSQELSLQNMPETSAGMPGLEPGGHSEDSVPDPPAEPSATSRRRPADHRAASSPPLSVPDVDDMDTVPPSARREASSAEAVGANAHPAAQVVAPEELELARSELSQAQAELASVHTDRGLLEERIQAMEGEMMRHKLRADMAEQELGEERARASAATEELSKERRLREQAEQTGADLREQLSVLEKTQQPTHMQRLTALSTGASANAGKGHPEAASGLVPVQTVQLMTAAISANALAMESLANNLQGQSANP